MTTDNWITDKRYMVYPTNSWVREDRIRTWYSDAVANGEVDHTDLVDIDEIMAELESTGTVTFSTATGS